MVIEMLATSDLKASNTHSVVADYKCVSKLAA